MKLMSPWRRQRLSRLALSVLLLGTVVACREASRDATNATAVARPPEFPRREKQEAAPPPTLHIIRTTTPFRNIPNYLTSRSVAVVAQYEISRIAQASACWPSLKPISDEDKRYTALLVAQISIPHGTKCTPEPAWVRSAVKRIKARRYIYTDFPTDTPGLLAIGVLGMLTYEQVAIEARMGKLRGIEPALYQRRWTSDVRIKPTGEKLIDSAVRTIIDDPRFIAAMGPIKVSLVDANPNVLMLRSYEDVLGFGHDDNDSRELLARRVTGGRQGFFPNANDFLSDYPLGSDISGFTVGNENHIFGAVCVNMGGMLHPSAFDEANAANCLLRALGLAGNRPSWSYPNRQISALEYNRLFPPLVGVKEEQETYRAFLSENAFAVLKAIYAPAAKTEFQPRLARDGLASE